MFLKKISSKSPQGNVTKGDFTIEPWYPNKKTAPNNYESVQVYYKYSNHTKKLPKVLTNVYKFTRNTAIFLVNLHFRNYLGQFFCWNTTAQS